MNTKDKMSITLSRMNIQEELTFKQPYKSYDLIETSTCTWAVKVDKKDSVAYHLPGEGNDMHFYVSTFPKQPFILHNCPCFQRVNSVVTTSYYVLEDKKQFSFTRASQLEALEKQNIYVVQNLEDVKNDSNSIYIKYIKNIKADGKLTEKVNCMDEYCGFEAYSLLSIGRFPKPFPGISAVYTCYPVLIIPDKTSINTLTYTEVEYRCGPLRNLD